MTSPLVVHHIGIASDRPRPVIWRRNWPPPALIVYHHQRSRVGAPSGRGHVRRGDLVTGTFEFSSGFGKPERPERANNRNNCFCALEPRGFSTPLVPCTVHCVRFCSLCVVIHGGELPNPTRPSYSYRLHEREREYRVVKHFTLSM